MQESGFTSARCSIRISLPESWGETMQYLLQEAGFGDTLLETHYPAGKLEGDGAEASICELRLLIGEGQLAELEAAVGTWTTAWKLDDDAWHLHHEMLQEEDLARQSAWKDRWRAFRCAGFVIYPEFWEAPPKQMRPDDQALQVLPGSAFGTGAHVTTRLALAAMRSLDQDGVRWERVMDVGTGSGILAVAARLMGAKQALGMDPDRMSPAQARGMAEANGVAAGSTFWCGTLASSHPQAYDLVLANLVAEILIEEAPSLAAHLGPQGHLFTGGVMASKRSQVVAAMQAAGLRPRAGAQPWRQRGRWCADIWCHS
jgi:ribosomal protein L11 methyltransferase